MSFHRKKGLRGKGEGGGGVSARAGREGGQGSKSNMEIVERGEGNNQKYLYKWPVWLAMHTSTTSSGISCKSTHSFLLIYSKYREFESLDILT